MTKIFGNERFSHFSEMLTGFHLEFHYFCKFAVFGSFAVFAVSRSKLRPKCAKWLFRDLGCVRAAAASPAARSNLV